MTTFLRPDDTSTEGTLLATIPAHKGAAYIVVGEQLAEYGRLYLEAAW